LNIGIITTWSERGASYVSRQYRMLLSPDHNVFIYARGGESFETDSSGDDKFVTEGKRSLVPVATAIDHTDFVKWVKANKIDIILFNEQHWWMPLVWCNDLSVATGAYVDYYTEETIPLFGAYDFLICHTKRHYSAFDWHPKSFYLPWGTNIDLYSPQTITPVKNSVITFFHSAGMSPLRKGCDLVVQAFAQLSGPAKLIIHTQTPLHNGFQHLQTLISQLVASGRLTIIEKTVPAPGLYHLGDVYVYPSRLDGIGLTLAEALACGLPVIASDNPPMNEFIDKTNGKLIKIDRLYARADGYYWPQCHPNLNSLKGCMQYYVDNFHSIAELKNNARQYAVKNLDMMHNKDSIVNLFSTIKTDISKLKKKSVNEIISFENNRLGLRQALSAKYPHIYLLLCHVSEFVKMLSRYKP